MWILEFFKLEIIFENKNFNELFGKGIYQKLDWKEIGVPKIHLKVEFF